MGLTILFRVIVGLSNPKNTCYQNVVFQLLAVCYSKHVESVKELIHVCFDIWLDLSLSLSSMMILLNMCYHLWHVGYVSESVFCLNAFPNYPVGDGAFSDIPFG